MKNLWDFCGAVYRDDDVKALCLKLQNIHGVDVPMFLAMHWVENGGLFEGDFADLTDIVAPAAQWQTDKVIPLRAKRREVFEKEGRGQAYADAMKQELAAEKQQIEMIEKAILGQKPAGADLTTPLNFASAYLATKNVSENDVADADRILKRAMKEQLSN